MIENLDYIFYFGLSVISTLFIMKVVTYFLAKVGQYDKPNGRKKHKNQTLTSAGILFIIQGIVLLILFHSDIKLLITLICGVVMGIVGFWDDRRDLSAKFKLIVQISLAIPIIYFLDPLPLSELMFNIQNFGLDFSLTVFVLVALVNGINLLDGMDGYLGSITLYSFVFLSFYFFSTEENTWGTATGIIAIGIMVFLTENFAPAKVFMGDTGSLILGFFLAGCLLNGFNSNPTPETAGSLVGLASFPLLDETRVFFGRILDRKPPLKADRRHFHHLLLNLKLTPLQIIALTLGIQLLMHVSGAIFELSLYKIVAFQGIVYFTTVLCIEIINYMRLSKKYYELNESVQKEKRRITKLSKAA